LVNNLQEMGLIVQKYGGSSVADAERLKAVAARIKRTVDAGNQVLVVVSAMGKTTDGLVALAKAVTQPPHGQPDDYESQAPNPRELDMLLATGEQVTIALLSMALQAIGQAAISFTGTQVRVVTEHNHTRARILFVETDLIRQHLDRGEVVVVAGFQGVAKDMTATRVTTEITTLGRGGSDTSAVALAAALEADLCEIYTDVPGIFTTDPRIVPNAQMLSEITSDEMLELASMGAKVLHPRSVEIARNFGVKMAVRSSWLDEPGTIVISPTLGNGDRMALEVNRFVDGVSLDRDQAKLALLQVSDRPGIAAQLFQALAKHKINVDLIIQAVQEPKDVNDIAFTVPKHELARAESVVCGLQLGEKAILVDDQVAKVSIVGVGIVGRPGIAVQMFTALAEAGINIQMISTSEIKVSCVIDQASGEKAIAALRETFNVPDVSNQVSNQVSDRHENIDFLPDLPPVRGVALDLNQARLAVRQVPDRPGIAASLLQHLADRRICVDMIIQSQSSQDLNEIAFTVPIGDADMAETYLSQAASELGCGEVVSDRNLAKVSIVGTGMMRATGVAAKMFSALAQSNINIEMIATSEIKVSCAIGKNVAETALKAIHQAFDLECDLAISVPGVVSRKAIS
jgi:aspartate kinase